MGNTKNKKSFNLHYYMLPRVEIIYCVTFTWTTERKTYERLHHLRKHCQTNTTKTLVLSPLWRSRPCSGLNLSPRWIHRTPSRSSRPPADEWSKRGWMIATEDSNATKTKHNNYTTKLNNWYLLNYLTLWRLLPTNEPTKRLNVPVLGINRNWHHFDNWVRNISSCPLDKNETRVLSCGLKHSVTPKRIPPEVIVCSVEAALSRQRELSESTKDNIRSRITSTLQSASQHIVSFCGSLTYQLSNYLTTMLQPLTDKSRRKLQSTEDFINATKIVQIPYDYKVVSFDVKSLFPSIPLQLALQFTETTILQSTDPLPLPTEDIMDLLNLCLTSAYFQYNGKHYKQLHGTATGSPVSVVVAEIVMQHRGKRSFDLPTSDTALVTLRWRYFHSRTTRRNRRIPPPP